ncbi:hypothetical protein Efla_006671 [Eimeria flavescens]
MASAASKEQRIAAIEHPQFGFFFVVFYESCLTQLLAVCCCKLHASKSLLTTIRCLPLLAAAAAARLRQQQQQQQQQQEYEEQVAIGGIVRGRRSVSLVLLRIPGVATAAAAAVAAASEQQEQQQQLQQDALLEAPARTAAAAATTAAPPATAAATAGYGWNRLLATAATAAAVTTAAAARATAAAALDSMNSCNVAYLRSSTALSRGSADRAAAEAAAAAEAEAAAAAAAANEQQGLSGFFPSFFPRLTASVSSLFFPAPPLPPVTACLPAAAAAATAAAAAAAADASPDASLQAKGRSSTRLVVLLQQLPGSSSGSRSSSAAAAGAVAAGQGVDAVESSLQRYLLCKLNGHPVLDAAPLEDLGCEALEVWADPQRLLLLLEETGAAKKTLCHKFAPFRHRCKAFFQHCEDADTFMTPHEEAELILGELLAMRFGVDAPFQSLQGLGVMDVCLATGLVCDVFPLHLPEARLSIHCKLLQQQQQQKKKQRRLRLANPSASLDSMLAAYCGFPMNSLFVLLRGGWRFGVSLLLLELLLLLLQLAGDRGAEEAARMRSVCAATAASAAAAATSPSAATQAAGAAAAAGTIVWGVSTDPLWLMLTSKAFKAAAALLTATCIPLFVLAVQQKLPACRYSLGLEALAHVGGPRGLVGGPGGLTEKPMSPLLLLQRRLRLLLLFGAAPSESLSFSCHPRFRRFFLPLFSGSAPPLQPQQQAAAAAAAAAAAITGGDAVAASRALVPPPQSLQQQVQQQQQPVAAAAVAAQHAQGFLWWRSIASLAAAAQLLLLLLLLLLHAEVIYRAAAPEEWTSWLAPLDAAASATKAAQAEQAVSAAAAPLWGPASLAMRRLRQSKSVGELLVLLLPLLLPILLRFAAEPCGLLQSARQICVSIVDASVSFCAPDILSASAESPSEKGYVASVQQLFLLLTTLGVSASMAASAAAASTAAASVGQPCSSSAFFALQLPLFFAAEFLRLLVASRVPPLLVPVSPSASSSSSSSSSSSIAEQIAAGAAAEAALPPLRLEYYYAPFCLELCLLPLAAAHRVGLLTLLLFCLLLPLRLREACLLLLQRRRSSSCSLGELPQSPLLAAGSGLGLVVLLGGSLSLLLLLQQALGDKGEADTLQGVYEMADREVSAFEFNFNILKPRPCVPARVAAAPVDSVQLPWVARLLSRFLSPLHQLQQKQGRQRWLGLLEQLLLPPLLPVEGGTSDLPLLYGGVRRLDATLLMLHSGDLASLEGEAADALNARRLEMATNQYIEEMLQRDGASGLSASASAAAAEPKELDKKVIRRFLGEWEFDRSRSSSMSPISEHLGVPWLVRNAVEKLNPSIKYELVEKDGQLEFAITTKLTAGISKTVRLNLSGANVEAEDEDVGAWSSVTRLEGSVLKTTQKNAGQKALLFETREIKPDGGVSTDALWYNVTLRKEGLPAEISAVRVFKRVSGPPPGVLEDLPPERGMVSEGSISTASSPAKEVVAPAEPEEAQQPVPQPIWKSFISREKAVSAELKWVVDHLDDPAVFQKSSCRGYETFKAANYKFHAADGQRTAEGEVVPVMGVGRINLGKLDFQKCIDYLVRPEVKMEFDASTSKGKFSAILTILTEDNFSLVYQSFKGQWGFAGREFVIACWNTKVDENRTILSCESVDWTEPIEGHVEGLVRANLLLGGYDLQRRENGDVILCFCAQADLKTTGVPEWINTRVKAEQLTVVKCIKDKMVKL